MAAPLQLTPQDAEILKRGHPWLYHGDRYASLQKVEPGTVLDCVGPDGAFVARGLSDPQPPIGLRILTRDPDAVIDDGWIAERVRGALAHRERFLDTGTTTAWRWRARRPRPASRSRAST